MDSEIYFDNNKYISAKRAAVITGYTSDYIGQLSREKSVGSRLIGRTRYVSENDILAYKNSQVDNYVFPVSEDLNLKNSSGVFSVVTPKTEEVLFPEIRKEISYTTLKFVADEAFKERLSQKNPKSKFEQCVSVGAFVSVALILFSVLGFNGSLIKDKVVAFYDDFNQELISTGLNIRDLGITRYFSLKKNIVSYSFEVDAPLKLNNSAAAFSAINLSFEKFGGWAINFGSDVLKPWFEESYIPRPTILLKDTNQNTTISLPTNVSQSKSVFLQPTGVSDKTYVDLKISELKEYILESANLNRYYVTRQNDAIVDLIPSTVSSGGGSSNVSGFDDLSDVSLSSSIYGNVLMFNGSEWVNTSTSSLNITVGGSASTTLLSDSNTFSGANMFTGLFTLATSTAGTLKTNSSGLVWVDTSSGSSASSTLLADHNSWTGVNRFAFASTTYASFGTASTTNLLINSELFNDLTGTGLALSGGALVNTGLITYDAWTHPLVGHSATSSSLIVGTSTGYLYGLTSASSTAPQLALSAGGGLAQWVFRNAGGDLFFSTTTVAGTATTSTSALSISGSGFGTTTLRGLNISGQATTTSNVGFNITTGCFAINGTCVGGGAGSSASSTLLSDFNTFSNTNNFTGKIGLASSTPWGQLSINPNALGSGVPEFVIGSSTATHFIVNGAGNVAIGRTAPTSGYIFDVNGAVNAGSLNVSSNILGGAAIVSGGVYLGYTGLNLVIPNGSNLPLTVGGTLTSNAGYDLIFNSNQGTTRTNTSGTNGTVNILSNYSPTSGTGVYNDLQLGSTFNQTGGANGITRGLYINPTITAAADYRAIETVRGNVLLGTTSGNVGMGATSTPWRTLSVNGTVGVPSLVNDSTGYYACVNTTTGQLSTSTTACGASSQKFKENIGALSYGLSEVLRLNPVFFDYKDSYMKNARRQVGFIAEEVAPIIPEVVAYDSNGEIQGLDYPKFTSVIVKAIQEQQGIIKNLQENGIIFDSFKNIGLEIGRNFIKVSEIVTQNLFAKKVQTEELCLEDVCLSKNQLAALINMSGVVTISEEVEQDNNDTSTTTIPFEITNTASSTPDNLLSSSSPPQLEVDDDLPSEEEPNVESVMEILDENLNENNN